MNMGDLFLLLPTFTGPTHWKWDEFWGLGQSQDLERKWWIFLLNRLKQRLLIMMMILMTWHSLGTEWTWAARKRTTKEMNRVSLILANMRWICNMPQICRATPELWGVQSPFGVHQQLSRSKVKPHPFIPTVFMPSPSPWPELLITFLLHLVARGCSNHQNLGQLSQIRLRQRG